MTLNDFFKSLKTKDVKITIADKEENELIRFYSDGYEGVENDIRGREVSKWFLVSSTSIRVYVEDAPEAEPEP